MTNHSSIKKIKLLIIYAKLCPQWNLSKILHRYKAILHSPDEFNIFIVHSWSAIICIENQPLFKGIVENSYATSSELLGVAAGVVGYGWAWCITKIDFGNDVHVARVIPVRLRIGGVVVRFGLLFFWGFIGSFFFVPWWIFRHIW